jgi:hypothetical protein
LAALWCLVPLVTVISAGIGLQTPTERVVASGLLRIHPAKLMVAMRYAPAVIGLSLIPLAGALVIHRGSLRSGWRLKGFAVAIAAMALVSVALFIREGGPWLPGDYLTAEGLNPWMYRVPGVKAALLPGAVFLAVEVLSVATFVAAVAVSPLRWKRTLFNPAAALLIVVAAGHFLTLMYTGPFDRYFLPVVIPLLPLAAGAVSVAKPSRIAMGWAVGSILLGVALYAAGEQDYEAWQLARSRAANIAYAMAPPAEVNAGYEADALNFEVPYYLANGHMSSPLPTIAATDEVVLRPRRVRLRLSFAPASDPAPGVTYESLAPGKVVIRVVDQ